MFLLSEKLKNEIATQALFYFGFAAFEKRNAFSFFEDMLYRGVFVADDRDKESIKDQCVDLHIQYRGFSIFWKTIESNIRKRWKHDTIREKKPKSPYS